MRRGSSGRRRLTPCGTAAGSRTYSLHAQADGRTDGCTTIYRCRLSSAVRSTVLSPTRRRISQVPMDPPPGRRRVAPHARHSDVRVNRTPVRRKATQLRSTCSRTTRRQARECRPVDGHFCRCADHPTSTVGALGIGAHQAAQSVALIPYKT